LQPCALLILVFEVQWALNVDVSRETQVDYPSVFDFGGLVHLIFLLCHLEIVGFLILHWRHN
jgi:hypothetical protein